MMRYHMPPDAKVIVFNDDASFVRSITNLLARQGHKIIATADSIQALEQILPTIEEADVALIDNQAPWKSGEKADYQGVGKAAEQRIRNALGEDVTTISLTATESVNYGEYHFPMDKIARLGEFVTSLPRKER